MTAYRVTYYEIRCDELEAALKQLLDALSNLQADDTITQAHIDQINEAKRISDKL